MKNLKKYDEALRAFEQAILIEPNEFLSFRGKLYLLNDLGKHEECLKLLEEVAKQAIDDKYNYLVHTTKGEALLGLKRYEAALAAFDAAIRCDKQYGYAYKGKIEALKNLRRFDEMNKYSELLVSGRCHWNSNGSSHMKYH